LETHIQEGAGSVRESKKDKDFSSFFVSGIFRFLHKKNSAGQNFIKKITGA